MAIGGNWVSKTQLGVHKNSIYTGAKINRKMVRNGLITHLPRVKNA